MTENLPSNPPQPHAPAGRRGEAGPPNLSAHPTAADQPTTEPSEGTDWQETARVLARAINTGDMSEVQERLDALAPAPQPAADLGDLTTWTPAEVAASPVGASRLIQRLDAVVTAVREVREEYFDEDGHTEPEDVWRLHRDLGRALDGVRSSLPCPGAPWPR